MSDPRTERFELFQLLDTLARPESDAGGRNGQSGWLPGSSGEPGAALAALSGGEGRVFRVKLGYNPNSSSLGTSVVVLLWGIGLAGLLFQLVGTWLMTAQGAPSLPGPSSTDGSGGHDGRALPPGAGESSGEAS